MGCTHFISVCGHLVPPVRVKAAQSDSVTKDFQLFMVGHKGLGVPLIITLHGPEGILGQGHHRLLAVSLIGPGILLLELC